MENFASLVPLVVFIPFAGMLINLFLGGRMSEKMIGFVASTAAFLAFAVALTMTFAATRYGFQAVIVNPPVLTSWLSIPSAGVEIPWQFRVDTLSLTMMLVVTGVGTLIHIYAVGYMHNDSRFPRFFVYLNLFLGFMLILVTGNNYLMMFVGWEGVGLCSFLLIGFWFDKARGEGWRNSNAARKAFIVNRVGDFGVLLAMFLIFWTFGTLDYYKPGEVPVVNATVESSSNSITDQTSAATPDKSTPTPTNQITTQTDISKLGVFGKADQWLKDGNHRVVFGNVNLPFETVLLLITFFLLIGVTGKSAQIPLFVWLPDAMAGPTPVSALIHAATMVTAGIYLITRSNVLFHGAAATSALVTLIGATTAIMAGFIAVGQWDIKKVLAYSTVSQLGFMVAAVGLGGYSAGMFHLVTHAFFKALLFLGAGSVIHGVEHGHHIAHERAAAMPHEAGTLYTDEHTEEEEVFDAQDMRNMGGLGRRMPITFVTYLIGTLALSGIFPLAGFWSKDEIIGRSLTVGLTDGRIEGYIAFGLLLIAAGFTAFYMWRQIRLVFLGQARTEAAANAPENGVAMTFPLMVLAALAIFGGLLNIPEGINLGIPNDALTNWLGHSVTYATAQPFNLLLAIIATVVAVGAIIAADRMYAPKPLASKNRDRLEVNPQTRQIFKWANAKLYWDETYFRLFVNPYTRASKWLADTLDWKFWHDYVHNRVIRDNFNRASQFLAGPVDRSAIDQGFLRIPDLVMRAGKRLRRVETGYVRTYAFTMLMGAVLVMIVILLPLFRQLLGR